MVRQEGSKKKEKMPHTICHSRRYTPLWNKMERNLWRMLPTQTCSLTRGRKMRRGRTAEEMRQTTEEMKLTLMADRTKAASKQGRGVEDVVAAVFAEELQISLDSLMLRPPTSCPTLLVTNKTTNKGCTITHTNDTSNELISFVDCCIAKDLNQFILYDSYTDNQLKVCDSKPYGPRGIIFFSLSLVCYQLNFHLLYDYFPAPCGRGWETLPTSAGGASRLCSLFPALGFLIHDNGYELRREISCHLVIYVSAIISLQSCTGLNVNMRNNAMCEILSDIIMRIVMIDCIKRCQFTIGWGRLNVNSNGKRHREQ